MRGTQTQARKTRSGAAGILVKLVLIALMYLGRVGGLTLIYAALSGEKKSAAKLPQERITVG